MMDTTNISERACRVMAALLKVPVERLAPSVLLRDDLGLDSLDTVEIVMELEAEFGVKLNTREAKVTTIGEVISYLSESIAEAAQGGAAVVAPGASLGHST